MISCGMLIDTRPARKGRKGVGGRQLGKVPSQPSGRLWAGIWGPAGGRAVRMPPVFLLRATMGYRKDT